MSDLRSKKVAELKLMCKEQGFPVSGTKAVLIARLNGETPVVPKKKKKSVSQAPVYTVHQKVKKPILYIRRNQFGHFEHQDTHFIFCPETQRVIGKQSDTGDITTLSEKDLEVCKEMFFTYQLPENLD